MIEMDGSSANLRLQIAGLLAGKFNLNQFQAWIAQSEASIELHGSDADIDLLNWVDNLLAEYTGDHITASGVLDALRAEYEARTPELAIASRSAM
jgi:hypothetical protein